MTPELAFAVLAFFAIQTGSLLWWGATLTVMVKHHDKTLLDHEKRLREVKL